VFNRLFGEGVFLHFWRSAFKTRCGLAVPRLQGGGGKLVIESSPVMFRWYEKSPAARFRRGVQC
jgi:hypothetical protein